MAWELFALVPAALLAGLLFWQGRNNRQAQQQQQQQSQQQLQAKEQQLAEAQQALQQAQQALSQSREDGAALKATLTAQQQAQQAAQEQLQQSLKHQADALLKQQSQELNSANKEQLGAILDPLKQSLGDFRKKVEDTYDKEARDRRGLAEQIDHLKNLNARISEDALNLTRALKGDNKAQGNWGEMVLETVLQQSGLRKDQEYHTQVNLQRDDKRLQPDVIVHLPDNKDVVIDAKVSLLAYERYHSADSDAERDAALAEHLASVRGQVRNLAGKAYQAADGVSSLDYVLLFIPVEGAYMLAMQGDDKLFLDAMEKNIMLVSPTTLLMALRTIHKVWSVEHQNQNAKEIARQAEAMYDKFVGFVASMDKVGNQLRLADESFHKARNQLADGSGNLVRRAQRMVKLGGIKATRQLPEDLANKAEQAPEDPSEP